MGRFRFTIASLLGVVLLVAVAFAALREATVLWDSVVFSLTAFVLLASVLLAVHRAGAARAYWLGFALFGVGYLAASLIPPVESRLVTRPGLDYLDSKIPGRNQRLVPWIRYTGKTPASRTVHTFVVAGSTQGTERLWDVSTGKLLAGPNGTTEGFARIGHSFVALLAALAGGRFSRGLHAAGRQPDERTTAPDVLGA